MARRKSGSETPERSKIERGKDVAYAKRSRTPGEAAAEDGDEEASETETEKNKDEKAAAAPSVKTSEQAAELETEKELPAIEPPAHKAEPWPDATPTPMKPVEPPRSRTETIGMPAGTFGRPPDMPRTTAPPPLVLGQIENPTHLPGPRDIPSGNPDDPAPAPGRVPPGDSRSLRKDDGFALIYRLATYVVTRSGKVGTRGQWRVVEYPTSAAASHAYAKECSRYVSDGFSDYRD